jgi:hypothetical protein
MFRAASPFVLAALLELVGCTVAPPTGPSFAAMPGAGKTYEQFQADDLRCRQTAAASIGNVTPGQAATQSAVGSAAVGAGLGAAAGALLGAAGGNAGAGTAIGAGTGLLAGGLIGAGTGQASAAGLQRSYDITYAQCMAAAGESVPDPNAAPTYAVPGYGYAYPPTVVYPAPVVVGPPAVGFGWGWRGW